MKAYRFALTLALPLLALQACATHEPSKEVSSQMARTEVVIQQADRSGVAVNSLPELQAAKNKKDKTIQEQAYVAQRYADIARQQIAKGQAEAKTAADEAERQKVTLQA